MRVSRQPVPVEALHKRYADAGGHADAYCAEVAAPTTLARFVEAFYTSPLFRIERWILGVAINRPSSDAEARALARGERSQFAAWTVEARTESQLVMCDHKGMTRSWFMVDPASPTRLWFGSAIAAGRNGRQIPPTFRALMWFHSLYSRALIQSAVRRMRAEG